MGWAGGGMRGVFAIGLIAAIGVTTGWVIEPLVGGASAPAPGSSAAPIGALPDPDTGLDPNAGDDAGWPSGDDAPPDLPAPPAAIDPLDPYLPHVEGYVWPLVEAKITTYFAPLATGSMLLGGVPVHNGLDLALPCWTPVRAAHSGTVRYAGRRPDPHLGFSSSVQPYYDELARRKLTATALAISVVIDDGNGLISVYVHLARATVKRGHIVVAGEVIGFEGATGNATGCHLHYSLYLAEGPWAEINPFLVEKWRYPRWMRLRIDPLLVLPLDSPDAATPVRGLAPPAHAPRYVAPTPFVPPPAWQ